MASASCEQLHEAKSLQFLVCDMKYPNGNYLIHQFVLRNCYKPSDSRSEGYIRYALRSFPSDQVNARRNEDGFTALHLAVMRRNSFMVKLLLSCLPTVDVNAKCANRDERTALHLAASGYYLESPFSKVKKNNAQITLDKEEKLEIVKVLLEYGANVQASDRDGCTALHYSVIHNEIDTFELLISKGLDVNAANHYGKTPLHEATKYGCLEAVKALLGIGANVEARDDCGNTALHDAAIHLDQTDIFELLISRGADVNAANDFGKTPLHVATMYGRLEAVKILVEIGANVEAMDDFGNTAIRYYLAEDLNYI